jgi:hypothetical protein
MSTRKYQPRNTESAAVAVRAHDNTFFVFDLFKRGEHIGQHIGSAGGARKKLGDGDYIHVQYDC